MESMDSFPSVTSAEPRGMPSLPDLTVTSEQFTSLKLHSVTESKSFLLLDANEYLKVIKKKFILTFFRDHYLKLI